MLDKQITVEGDRVYVTLSGSMQEEQASLLGQDLLGYMSQGHYTYVIDLSGLQYVDSSGLGVLIALNKLSLRSGGSVTLKGLQGTVDELFEVTRLKKVFKIEA